MNIPFPICVAPYFELTASGCMIDPVKPLLYSFHCSQESQQVYSWACFHVLPHAVTRRPALTSIDRCSMLVATSINSI